MTENKRIRRTEDGNTISSSVSTKKETTVTKNENKQPCKLKNWFFTLNNYNEQDIADMCTKFNEICIKYLFQEEIGANNTPHLQGAIWLKKEGRYSEFKLNKRIHWESTRNESAAAAYCRKDDTLNGRRFSMGFPKPLKIITELRKWQKTVYDSLLTEPHKRHINWIYDEEGLNGKTEFVKYCAIKLPKKILFSTAGCAKDIANLIKNSVENSNIDLNDDITFLFNYTRDTDMTKISYNMLENVKDGLITNTKYEAQAYVFNNPHVWVLCNDIPCFHKLTMDRWKLWKIVNHELIEIPPDDWDN